MEFTGERYVPTMQGQIRLEHYHRYALVLDIVKEKSVLDIACGEGYGSFLMADVAQHVCGVDISSEAVAHAASSYAKENLEYQQGSATDLKFPDAHFDVVVSFETIEHLAEQEQMLSEIRRVLRPDGFLVISSPNRPVYKKESCEHNEFHVKELDYQEFDTLLRSQFPTVEYFGQRLMVSSVIKPLHEGSTTSSVWLDDGSKLNAGAGEFKEPVYFVAVCGANRENFPKIGMTQLYPSIDIFRQYVEWAQILNTKIASLGQSITERDGQIATLNQTVSERDGQLARLKNSRSWRITKPLRWLGLQARRARNAARYVLRGNWAGLAARVRHLHGLRREEHHLPQPMPAPDTPVDIIVPVYKGLDDTRRCLESVLASQCRTPWRLIVIDDASPQAELSAWLREFAQRDARVQLLVNENNLGFVGTVNRGMRESDANDVLLLNSDTEVAGDWLDRLRAAAYSDQRVASVTPFSNNATICSWPVFCEDNELPAGWDCARIDALMARVNAGQVVDVPTGVGFCMYIRRAALEAVGLFDEESFGKGYGEENDFCCRATRAGWRNLHALDTFVQHYGGVSFGDAKKPREASAMRTMRRLHPRYEAQVQRFIARDPARLARARASFGCLADGAQPLILNVLHDRGGGTERHTLELATHLVAHARTLMLLPAGSRRVALRLGGKKPACELLFTLPDDEQVLLDVLRQLQVRHVHYHHLIGHSSAFVRELPARLGVSYDFTAHDYYTLCPQFSLTEWHDHYCGEHGEAQCAECLKRSPAPDGSDIAAWRQRHADFLTDTRYLVTPSRDAAARLARLAPDAQLAIVPHTDIAPGMPLPEPAPAPVTGSRALKVAVIGAMSRIKGADMLEAVAIAAKKSGAPVEFHLLGYAYYGLKTEPGAALTISGRYDEAELPHMLRQLQPDVVWFPAQCPETYSYTLSACLLAGLPVAAPDLGAFPERLAGRAWSWVCDWQQTPQEWLDFFTRIRTEHFTTGLPPAPCLPIADIKALESVRGIPTQDSAQWYRNEYLAGLALRDGAAAPDNDVLAAHLGVSGGGVALTLARRLSSLPLLAPLVRAVPTRWRARIKGWLSR